MIGENLGHYNVVCKLGAGGMGEVFVALDTKLSREVALKVLPAEMAADAERRQRFEREARAVAALNHPNIVTIHSVEEAGGVHFLTMELVAGKTLSELIPKDGMSLGKLFEIALPLTDALATAHQTGITHRDLKPDNIMIDDAGRVKVLDFGLAKLREEAPVGPEVDTRIAQSVTQEGRILGTAAYMSPEQAEGKPVDPRSDVFSLGIILYEMVTGHRPFGGDTTISTISSILRDQPRSITELKRSLPRHLGRIVKRSLAKDPQRRYQSALDLRNELEELKEEIDSGELDVDASPSTAPAAPASGRWGLWLGAAAVVLAAAALAVVMLRPPAAEPAAGTVTPAVQRVQMKLITEGGRTGSVTISPDGNYVAHARGDSDGRAALWLRQVATGSDVQVVPPERLWPWGIRFSPDGNYLYFGRGVFREDRSDLFRVPVLGGDPRKILEHITSPIDFAPDRKRFVFVRSFQREGKEDLVVAHADGSVETVIATRTEPTAFSSNPAWSPDGERIVVAVTTIDGGPLESYVEIPAAGGPATAILAEPWKRLGSPIWLRDGSGFVANAGNSWFAGDQLWFFAYPGGAARQITAGLANYSDPSVTDDGRFLVAGRSERRRAIWVAPRDDLGAMRPWVRESETQPGVEGMDWTPEGDLVYTVVAGGDVLALRVVPADGGSPRVISSGEHVEARPSLTPDGRVVFVSERGGKINLWIRDLDGGNLRQLTTGLEIDPSVTPDGRWIVYISIREGAQRLWRMPLDGSGEPEEIVDMPVTGYALSLDGTRIAVRHIDPESNRFETQIRSIDGELIRAIEGIPSPPRFSPDPGVLVYTNPDTPVRNLWAWPLDGSEPYPLTRFDDPRVVICGSAWSKDGSRLAVNRCRTESNGVMISEFR